MQIELIIPKKKESTATDAVPFYLTKVSAGFPTPAEDYMAECLDLNKLLIKNSVATFYVRASGNSMTDAGIHSNDILVVDRSLKPYPRKIVIAAVDGQLTVKNYLRKMVTTC